MWYVIKLIVPIDIINMSMIVPIIISKPTMVLLFYYYLKGHFNKKIIVFLYYARKHLKLLLNYFYTNTLDNLTMVNFKLGYAKS